LEMPMFREFP